MNRFRKERVKDFIIQVITGFTEKKIGNFASSTAFFFFISLIPICIILSKLMPLAGMTEAELEELVARYTPDIVDGIVHSIIEDAFSKGRAVVSISLLAVLYTSGKGMMALIQGMNAAYGIREHRNYFRLAFVSIIYTGLLLIFLIGYLVLMVFGEGIYRFIDTHVPDLENGMAEILGVRYVLVIAVAVLLFSLIYTFLPAENQRFRKQLPGAVFAMAGWVIFSKVFSVVITHGSIYSTYYGSLAAIVIFMLWMYGVFYILLIGGYINVVYEKMANEQVGERVYKGGKYLRCGVTTGTCAAAAAGAAAMQMFALWQGKKPRQRDTIEVALPEGGSLSLRVESTKVDKDGAYARCAVKKDAGDDPDVTDGMLLYAEVRKLAESDEQTKRRNIIRIDGGKGIGRVTKPGLDQPVGEAAINSVPRRMIERAVLTAAKECGYTDRVAVDVLIEAPEGEKLAERTFNPRLGIEGGISILGTSGIVRPMSNEALVDTMRTEVRMLQAQGESSGRRRIVFVPGNQGENYAVGQLHIPRERIVNCSNFIGEALVMAEEFGFKEVLFVGHFGKLEKLAAGIMNTHSKQADARMEILSAAALAADASAETAKQILHAKTTEEALAMIEEAGALEQTLRYLGKRIDWYLKRHVGEDMTAGAVLFTAFRETPIILQTRAAKQIMNGKKRYGR